MDILDKHWLDGACGYSTHIFVTKRSGENANSRLHAHDFYELVVITSGRAGYTYFDHEYEIHTGDAFIVPPGCGHCYHDQRGLELLNFLWYPDALPVDFQKMKDLRSFRAFFELEPDSRNNFSFEHHLLLNSEQIAEVEKIHRRMTHEQEGALEGGQLCLTFMLYELLIKLGRYYGEMGCESEPNELIRMERVAEHVEENFMRHIPRSEAAKIFSRSERIFADAFTRIFGMSFSDYLTQIRLRHAQQMLRETPKRITDIALECGFCDSNYFCAVFRRKYGITPRQYRLKEGS
ncbi:MAG: AraC family transcriptional regulator [Lentisphaeria bacterium]|nr:AraC family transcriptional regulator [Lentisphaeria bacterium]